MQADLAVGAQVRVREDYPPGHIRTPVYIRGKMGRIACRHGSFPNPELLCLGRDGLPKKVLYTIAFRQTELWPDYAGSADDTLLIEIYEHWLTPP